MKKLNIFVCENFSQEYQKIVYNERFEDVVIKPYPCMCEDSRKKAKTVMLLQESTTKNNEGLVLCSNHCEVINLIPEDSSLIIKTSKFCFSHLANEQLVNYIHEKGGYVIGLGWLNNWRERIEKAGFDRDSARIHYKSFCKELVFFDAGIGVNVEKNLNEVSQFLELPYFIIPFELEYFQIFISSAVYKWRLHQNHQEDTDAIAKLQSRCAEYSFILDLIGRISSYTTKQDAIEKIEEIFVKVLGAQKFEYWDSISENNNGSDHWKELFLKAEDIFLLLKEENKFYITIQQNSKVYGTLEIGDFLFPEYIEKYLSFAIEITKICGLVLSNIGHYEELVKAKERSEVASSAKSQFLANMSHEIRTPINGVVGMLQVLETTELTKDQAEYIKVTKGSTDSLLKVINDILDYSKIEAGKLELEKLTFNLRDLTQELLILFKLATQSKGLIFDVHIEENVPDSLVGDAFRLRQILLNLIGNAIKFTHKGRIDIGIREIKNLAKKEIKLEFTVKDTGIGIPEDRVNSLFNSFNQADSSTTRQYGGTGLGLSICKGIVERMQGEVWVESKEGVGTDFHFTCVFGYCVEEDYTSPKTDPTTGDDTKEVGLKLLIVEDDAISRMVVEKFASIKGWLVILAENGKEAIDAYRDNCFDAILMDVQIPILDGYKATGVIRLLEKQRGTYTPIIAMTAHALKSDRQKCLEAGMDDYISKPIDAKVFHAVIEKWAVRKSNDY